MKKVFTAIIIMLVFPLLLQASDTCNCSTGNPYMGALPGFCKHNIGLRYNYSSLHSYIGTAGTASYSTTLEKYHTAELWGGWNIARKIRIMGSVPYRFEELTSKGATTSKSGPGDMHIIGYYNLLNKRRITNPGKLLAQTLWFGAGVEMPTGKYDSLDKNKLNESGNLFQLGSGSTDFLFDVLYAICLQNAGLNVASMYKINTVNKYGYEYGNRFNINAQVYYNFSMKHTTTVAPVMGVLFENYQHAEDNGHWVETGEGNLIMGTIGIETRFKSIAIGGNFQTPLHQSLGNGIVKYNNRCMLYMSFAL